MKIKFIFNGETVTKQTDNIEKAILDVAPDFLHTEMFVSIKTKEDTIERKLNLLEGRKLFANETFREIFINNLLIA